VTVALPCSSSRTRFDNFTRNAARNATCHLIVQCDRCGSRDIFTPLQARYETCTRGTGEDQGTRVNDRPWKKKMRSLRRFLHFSANRTVAMPAHVFAASSHSCSTRLRSLFHAGMRHVRPLYIYTDIFADYLVVAANLVRA